MNADASQHSNREYELEYEQEHENEYKHEYTASAKFKTGAERARAKQGERDAPPYTYMWHFTTSWTAFKLTG